ncbi:hypothetical protein ACFQAS_07160 [Halopenitus salinus]|uniref:DUF7308 domain-containing protein n=1 Tax=Halopenitus salinus TaxID=1198295 RepID=A0ABD5UZP1_9EURY
MRRGLGGTRKDERAVSASVGVVLIVAITLMGATAVVTLGSTAIGDTQQAADVQRGEHVMTQFASKAAMAALGDTGSQSMTTGDTQGTISVTEETGRMQVYHVNASGDGNVGDPIANSTLGEVTHRNDDRTTTYQGGGVWSKRGENPARMVSPPEFHYRGQTLTLPIVSVAAGETAAASGSSQIRVEGGDTIPSNGTADNPVENGTVVVVVESEYHEGWREYFEDRTDGRVVETEDIPAEWESDLYYDDPEKTVVLELETAGTGGSFDLPGSGERIPVDGFTEREALEEFSTTFDVNQPNQGWVSFHGKSGDQYFETVLQFDNGQGASTPICEANFDARMLYTDGDVAHHWKLADTSGKTGGDFATCENEMLRIDFLATEEFTYVEEDPGSRVEYQDVWGGDYTEPAEINTTADTVEKNLGDAMAPDAFVPDYLERLGPSFELQATWGRDKGNGNGNGGTGGNSMDIDDDSTVTFEYDRTGEGRYVTYLHVTDNTVTVEFG